MISARYPRLIAACFALVAILAFLDARAATYHVSTSGSDAADGLSEATAYRTIQKGVNQLQPGDTLVIGPGEYFESVSRQKLGGPDADTRIQAMIPGSVILRGDVAAPEFRKVPGSRFLYEADFDRPVIAVNEEDTLQVFAPATGKESMEFQGGLFFYDPAAKKLFVTTSDYQPIEQHRYTISVLDATGLLLNEPQRVVVEGIVARGYNTLQNLLWDPDFFTRFGILLRNGKQSVIRNCTALLNGSGLAISSGPDGGGNIIEDSVAYGNFTELNQEGGNITGFHANNDIIRRCVSFRSGLHGIRFYNKTYGPALIQSCLSWGNFTNDIALKGIDLNKFGLAENTIGLGPFDADHLENCIVGGTNRYRRTANPPSASNILFASQSKDWTKQFADPENFDFRLQADSSYRGKGIDGADPGPFPYKANIYYVREGGKDTNDGLSMDAAWATLDRAIPALRAGDTLYVSGEGEVTQPLTLAGTEDQPIAILGRGKDLAVIKGLVNLEKSQHVRFERVAFADGLSAKDGAGLEIKNVAFPASSRGLAVEGQRGLEISHSLFQNSGEASLELKASPNAVLSEIAFLGAPKVFVRADEHSTPHYSDYQAFRSGVPTWETYGKVRSLSELQASQDWHSREVAVPAESENGTNLENLTALVQGSAAAQATGIALFHLGGELRATALEIHSTSATTANLEWYVNRPSAMTIAWGDTPECTKSLEIEAIGLGAASLTGLKPGTTYYARIRSLEAPRTLAYSENIQKVEFPKEPVSFRTPAEDAPAKTYFVAADGSDSADGLGQTSAWKTLQHAANTANAGDIVTVLDGVYSETVRVRATGTAERPIRFQAANVGEAVIDGGKRIGDVFRLSHKNHIHIDGFTFRHINNYASSSVWWMLTKPGAINAYLSDDLKLTRLFYDGRQRGYSSPFLNVWKCRNLSVENSVLINLFNGMIISECPGMLIKNNVFLRNKIRAANIFNDETQTCRIENNIFTDNLKNKASESLFEVSRATPLKFKNNAFFVRGNDPNRVILVVYDYFGEKSKRVTMSDYDKRLAPSDSLFADPDFAASETAKGHEIDRLVADEAVLSPASLFARNPEFLRRNIGLEPAAFAK